MPPSAALSSGRPLRWQLLSLVLGVILPVLAVATAASWRFAEAERERIEAAAAGTARDVAAGLDIFLAEAVTTAQILANSAPLAANDLAAFHPHAVEAARLAGGLIGLRDAQSRQILNSALPWGAPLPTRTSLAAADAEAARTGRPVISDSFVGIADEVFQVAVVVPLAGDGPARFLNLSIPASRIQRVIEAQTLPPGVVAGVVDRQGLFLAHSRDGARQAGQPASLRPDRASSEGRITGRNVSSAQVRLFYQRSSIAGWRAGVSVPLAALRAPVTQALATMAALGLLALVLVLLAASMGARRIGRSIAALTDAAAALGEGRSVPPIATPLREANAVGAALAAAATERQERDAALRRSEERLRRLIEAAHDHAIVTIDTEERVTLWSRGAENLFGYAAADILGQPFATIFTPEDRAAGIPAAELRTAAANGFAPDERWHQRRDASRFWASGSVVPLRTDGVLEGYVKVCRDETERKLAADRLRGLNEALEARVEEEVAARGEAMARLAQGQRMEALGRLAGGVAHDFNNVLQAVIGGAQLIQAAPENAARVQRIARMVAEAAERGASVSRRLLAVSRRADLRAEPVAVEPLLEGLREVLLHTLGAGIEVEVEVAPGLAPVFADKGQLETVLINLATNARDAMDGQGVLTLSARTDPRDAEALLFSVRDGGSGMDATTLARATEPFFTTKAEGQGTGLGLAMARGFAEQSGGSLAIESVPGSGTLVTLQLPAARGAPRAPAGAAPPARGRGRILLVDDEAMVRDVMAEGLRLAGYEVSAASDAATALALLEDPRGVDVLVTDLSMPGADGVELIREARLRRPDLPAILLTGFSNDVAESALSEARPGSPVLLRKPVAIADLCGRLDTLLRMAAPA